MIIAQRSLELELLQRNKKTIWDQRQHVDFTGGVREERESSLSQRKGKKEGSGYGNSQTNLLLRVFPEKREKWYEKRRRTGNHGEEKKKGKEMGGLGGGGGALVRSEEE